MGLASSAPTLEEMDAIEGFQLKCSDCNALVFVDSLSNHTCKGKASRSLNSLISRPSDLQASSASLPAASVDCSEEVVEPITFSLVAAGKLIGQQSLICIRPTVSPFISPPSSPRKGNIIEGTQAGEEAFPYELNFENRVPPDITSLDTVRPEVRIAIFENAKWGHQFLFLGYPFSSPTDPKDTTRMRLFTIELFRKDDTRDCTVLVRGPVSNLQERLKNGYKASKCSILRDLRVDQVIEFARILLSRFGSYQLISRNCRHFAEELYTCLSTHFHGRPHPQAHFNAELMDTLTSDYEYQPSTIVEAHGFESLMIRSPTAASSLPSSRPPTPMPTPPPVHSSSSSSSSSSRADQISLAPVSINMKNTINTMLVKLATLRDMVMALAVSSLNEETILFSYTTMTNTGVPTLRLMHLFTTSDGPALQIHFQGPLQDDHVFSKFAIKTAVALTNISIDNIALAATVLLSRFATFGSFQFSDTKLTRELYLVLKKLYVQRTADKMVTLIDEQRLAQKLEESFRTHFPSRSAPSQFEA